LTLITNHDEIYFVSDKFDFDNQIIEIVNSPSKHKIILTSPWSFKAYDTVVNKIRSGFPYGDAGGGSQHLYLNGEYGEQILTSWAYPPLGYVQVYRSLIHYGGFVPPKSTSYSFNFYYRQKGQIDVMGTDHPLGESCGLGAVYFRFYLWDGETTSFDTGNMKVYRKVGNGITDGYPYDITETYKDSDTLQKGVLYTFGAIGRAETEAGAGTVVRGDARHTVDWTGLEKVEVEWLNSPPNTPTLSSPSNGASDISTSPTLRWDCDDPDGKYESLEYDVYLGTSSSPSKLKSGVTGTSYSTSNLKEKTKYYWKIVVRDSKGEEKTSSVWSFTTKKEKSVDRSITNPVFSLLKDKPFLFTLFLKNVKEVFSPPFFKQLQFLSIFY
jgi:hypothetical protein